jgi:hypothetical protein
VRVEECAHVARRPRPLTFALVRIPIDKFASTLLLHLCDRHPIPGVVVEVWPLFPPLTDRTSTKVNRKNNGNAVIEIVIVTVIVIVTGAAIVLVLVIATATAIAIVMIELLAVDRAMAQVIATVIQAVIVAVSCRITARV